MIQALNAAHTADPVQQSLRTPEPPAIFLRLPAVTRLTGRSRSTIYRLVAARKFPDPVALGPRAVAWRRTEIERRAGIASDADGPRRLYATAFRCR